jgi:DNA-directed RNA polymerase subunit M/transcription elongation factor TFIIS
MAFKGMRFCRECDNMLQPKEQVTDESRSLLIYDCRICGYFERARPGDEADNCVYRSEQTKMHDKLFVDRECIKDPCLSRRPMNCKKCGHGEAVTYTNPTKDRMNLIFVCTNCTHYWRKDELD